MRLIFRYTLLFLGLSITLTLKAQDENQISLDKIFNELMPEWLEEVTWSPDGNSYIQWQDSEEVAGLRNLVSTHIPTGKVETLLSLIDLIPSPGQYPLIPYTYEFSPDHAKVLLFTNQQKGWRTYNRGDYWVFDLSTKKLQQLGKDLPAGSMMNAKFSPDGLSVAFVHQYNLYLENIESTEISQLTQNGNDVFRNAAFDWAYEEEFSCYDGYQWSPDGESIAYWQFDLSEMKEFKTINFTDSLYPKLKVFRHPKVGEKPAAVKMGILDLKSGNTDWVNLNEDLRSYYIPRIQWIKDQLLIQQLNRAQNELTLWLCKKDGRKNQIYHETSSTWIDIDYWDYPSDNFEKLPLWKGSLLRLTEMGDWRHIQGISLIKAKETLLW